MKKILIALLFANLMAVNTISSFAQETSYSEGEIPSAPSSDWSIYENDLASQGSDYTFDKLFANDTPIIVENDLMTFTLNRYAYYDIFNGQYSTKSIMLEMTYKNKSDQKLYVNPEYIGTFIGQSIPIENMTLSFSNEDLSIINKLKKMKNTIPPKSELSGAVLLNISFLEAENLEENPAIYFDEPKVYAQKEDGTTYYIFPSEYMLLPLSQERIDRLALEPVYYPDRITSENWGTKSIIEFAELNQTITAYDIDVTLNGMQTVDFLPNSLNRQNFDKWQNGVVLFTVGITIKNNSAQVINIDSTIGHLVLDLALDYPQIGNFEIPSEKPLLQPGEEGQRYLVFGMTKEDYLKHFGNPDDSTSVDISLQLFDDANQLINQDNPFMYRIKE